MWAGSWLGGASRTTEKEKASWSPTPLGSFIALPLQMLASFLSFLHFRFFLTHWLFFTLPSSENTLLSTPCLAAPSGTHLPTVPLPSCVVCAATVIISVSVHGHDVLAVFLLRPRAVSSLPVVQFVTPFARPRTELAIKKCLLNDYDYVSPHFRNNNKKEWNLVCNLLFFLLLGALSSPFSCFCLPYDLGG